MKYTLLTFYLLFTTALSLFSLTAGAQVLENDKVVFNKISLAEHDQRGFAADRFGNTYTVSGSVNFPDGTSLNGDINLFKHDVNGNYVWGKSFNADYVQMYDIHVGPDDNIYISGHNGYTFIPDSINPTANFYNSYFIAKVSPEGTVLEAIPFPGRPNFEIRENGNIVFAFEADPGYLGPEYIDGAILLYGELNSDLDVLWKTRHPGWAESGGLHMVQGCAYANNQFFFYGNFDGPNAGDIPVTLNNPTPNQYFQFPDWYIAALDLTTHEIVRATKTNRLMIMDIEADNQGKVYVALQHFTEGGDGSLAGKLYPHPGNFDGYVQRLNNDFSYDASYDICGPYVTNNGGVYVHDIVLNNNELYVFGRFFSGDVNIFVRLGGVNYVDVCRMFLIRLDKHLAYKSSVVLPHDTSYGGDPSGFPIQQMRSVDDHLAVLAETQAPVNPTTFPHSFFIGRYRTNSDVITGRLFKDYANDGVFNGNDTPLSGVVVQTTPGNLLSVTDPDGTYKIYVDSGKYVVEIPDAPTYYSRAPQSATVTFDGYNQVKTADLRLIPVPGGHDLKVDFFSLHPVVVGDNAAQKIIVTNAGTFTEQGTVKLTPLNYSLPIGATVTSPAMVENSGELSYDFTGLEPGDTFSILVNYYIPASYISILNEETETVVKVDLPGDSTPLNNTASLNEEVLASYDPNLKEVNRPALIHLEDLPGTEDFSYTIHFQNEGNYHATNILVEDELSELLDIESINIIDYSHPVQLTIRDRRLQFHFDSIMLPAKSTDEEGSKGYVHFRVKRIPGLETNDSILNQASIYFDFNPPIITNTVSNVIIGNAAIAENGTSAAFVLYPNPAATAFRIDAPKEVKDQLLRVQLVDLTGSVVIDMAWNNLIAIDQLSTGIYQVIVTGLNNQVYSRSKLVKR